MLAQILVMGSSDHFTDSDLWVSFKMNERLEKPEDSKSELINYLSGSYCISHAMNERLEKPEDSKQVN